MQLRFYTEIELEYQGLMDYRSGSEYGKHVKLLESVKLCENVKEEVYCDFKQAKNDILFIIHFIVTFFSWARISNIINLPCNCVSINVSFPSSDINA